MAKKFADLRAADFPGVDPERFFEWWKEEIFWREEMGMDREKRTVGEAFVERELVGPLPGIFQALKAIPLGLRCRKLQKQAGISKEMIKQALKGRG
ncbi:MAG: hypothetical protein NTW95_10000 [Candidatus Aminicenantes bacterium]|nr:hypothetical protein [Candidatus Aminicenantes bacterium]